MSNYYGYSHAGYYQAQTSSYSPQTIISGAIFGGAAAAAVVYFYWSSSSSESESSKKAVSGLANLGNTCYANALLQALSSCPSLVGWLRSIDVAEGDIHGGFIDSLRTVVLGLNEPNATVLNAGSVVSSLSKHGWNIQIGVEHDLYELFNVFVTTWDDELKEAKRRMMPKSIEDCQEGEDNVSNPKESPTAHRKLKSFENCALIARLEARLRAPCTGLTATEFRCCNVKCGYRTVKYETFTALTLSIPNSQMGTATNCEQLLRRYFCSEIIRDATCQKCKSESRKQQGFLKKHGIIKLPQTLLIRIERVGMLPSGHLKLNEHVSFGECLSLQDVCFRKSTKINQMSYEDSSKWQLPDGTSRVVGGAEEVKASSSPIHPNGGACGSRSSGCDMTAYSLIDGGSFVSERRETQKYTYQLRAVCEHRGGPFSGHFVTYRRATAPNHFSWYLTNDSQVQRVPYSQVANCQAYMLFYERIRPNRWYERS